MPIEVLAKEIANLPEDSVKKVMEYIQFLQHMDQKGETSPEKLREERHFGGLANQFVSISPDFDDTLEGLEDYGVPVVW